MILNLNKTQKLIAVILLLVTAILSFTVVTNYTTSVENHVETIETLDEKKMEAMELTAGLALASSAVALMPGDSTTPIATQLAELADILLIVVATIYLEKFMLTTIGYVSFAFLIPLACAIMIFCILTNKDHLQKLALKFAVFAVVIYLIVPVSITVTNTIETTFDQSISETYDTAIESTKTENKTEEGTNLWSQISNKVTTTVTNLTDSAERTLSKCVDAVAVSLITTCLIPIMVIFFAVWIVKLFFGVTVEIPKKPVSVFKNNKLIKNNQTQLLEDTKEP